MDKNELSVQGNNQVSQVDTRSNIMFVQDQFGIKQTVESLHEMMKEVTKEDFNAANVNAACHCVHQLNQVIDTTIKAAKFLANGK